MHDRKLTECVKTSGSGSPETPLKETADLEQHPAGHEAAAPADGVPEAGPPVPLSLAGDTASDIPVPAGEPEHSAEAGTAEPPHQMAPLPDAFALSEISASAVPPDEQEAKSPDAPSTAGDTPVTAPCELDEPPPGIAAATQDLAAGEGQSQLTVDQPPELIASEPAGQAPAHPPEPSVHQEEPAVAALQAAAHYTPDHDRPDLPSETAGEFDAGTIELPPPPPSEPEAAPPAEAAQPDWNFAGPAASDHASIHAVPAPLLTIPAAPAPTLEVPQVRTVASGAPSVTKPRKPFRLIATAFRYAVIAFCGWLAAMAVLIAVLRFVNPPSSALMLIRSAQGVEIDQRWVPLAEISPNLIRAVIASEDGRFCSHWGIDPREVLDAIRDANGSTPRGASTMTMQLAKNLFLWPHQSYIRKALEVPLTLALDAMWPKSRIAEVYLNVVEWGPGIFGAEAAARRHFDTSAAKLSQRQSALLAVTLPNPNVRKPAKPSRMLNRMASTIVARMRSTPAADDCVTKAR